MLSWTLIALGLNFLACSFAEEQKDVTVNNVNIDPALLLEHEKLMNGARLAIERITNQRMSLLRKRQTNETDSDAGSARSKGEGEEEHDDGQYHHHEHDDHHDHDHGKWDIRHSVPGEPTVDYPVYAAVPSTMFTCTGLPQGYYADKEARCQVFHVCSTPPLIVKSSFLCPNGSIFSQEHLVCEWWNMVNCTGERGSEILAESDLGNKNIANDSMTIIQSFTDDLSLNSNKEQNKVIETDPGDSVMDLEDNEGAGILAITDDSSLNINSNKTVIVSSSLNDSSLYYEEKKKNMIEAAKEVDNSNIPDNNKNQIVPSVDDSGYTYEDAAQKNVSFSLDDSSTYNKFENKSKVTTSNQDESGFSLENVKTKGYAYETPENPLTYPTVTTPSSTTPDFYLDFDLEPRKSDGDSAITTFDSNVKNPLDGIRTNLNNQQITSINEGLYNAFSPSTPAPGYDYSRPLVSTFSPSSPNPTLGYSYSTPSTPFPYPNEINQLNDVKTPAISTFSPSSPNPTFGYSYSSPSTPFSYPNEIKQSNDLKTRYQEDTRYTTAKFPSSTVYPDTFKTQTPADFPSTTLSPPTFNENSGVTFGFTETSLPKFETTPSPIPESDSNTGVSQKVFTGTNSADEKLNFNSLSVSNDGGSGLINVGSTVQTPPSTPAVASVAPSQSSSTGFSNTETGSVQQSSTPPFRGFSGEPFSIKSTTDFPFDNQDLVSQVSQTFEDENGTVVTRVDFKFASENRTTSEETTNTFENKTVTRVITLPSSDLPTDDFLNELNSLSQSELRVEPSSIEFESSSNPNFVPSSQSSSNPNFIQISKDDTETSRQSSARFSTAKPVTTAFRDDDEEPQSPSKLLIPLSNYEEQSSIETSKNSIPDVQEFASLEKYRVKTKTQNSKNIAYYPNKPELNNNFQTQNFQSSQVAITQRTPSYDLKFNNAYVNQPVAYQSAVPINYQPSQNSQYQNQQQINLNLLEYILRTSVPQQNFSPQQNYYPQQSYYPQQGYYTQQNYYPQQTYHSQQALFNPYLEQVRSLLSSGVVNNLDLTKMNYNSGQNLNTLFTSANNQAQRYVVPQQSNKFEQRSFQADIVPSVSFDFDSNEGIRQFNRATSTGLVRRKKRDT